MTAFYHYSDVIVSMMASQITSLTIVYSTRKHQSSTSLAFVWGIRRWPVNSPHKGPVTRKMFPFDDVIMHMTFMSLINCPVVPIRPYWATQVVSLAANEKRSLTIGLRCIKGAHPMGIPVTRGYNYICNPLCADFLTAYLTNHSGQKRTLKSSRPVFKMCMKS